MNLQDAYLRELGKALGAQVEGVKQAKTEARKEAARGAFERAVRRMKPGEANINERDQTEG